MKVYVYSKNSSRFKEKTNKFIIEKLKEIYPEIVCIEYDNFINSNIDNIEYLILSGGDGIIHNVINYCYKRLNQIVFGFIPTGTANDYCHNIGIKSVKEAINVIKTNNINESMIIDINNEIAMYAISIGKMSKVSIDSKRKGKKIFHKLIYIFKGIRYLFCKKSKVIITMNGQRLEEKVKVLLIFNSKYLGGAKVRNQMLLNGIGIIKIKNIFDLINLFIFGRFKRLEKVVYEELIIESDTVWCVDGEEYNKQLAKINISKNKIRLLSKNT